MKRRAILLAAALVLAADAFVLVETARNRSGSPTSAIELTERELRLVRPQTESTALFLQLAWEPSWSSFKFKDGPEWFDQAKLEELGYDCRLPLIDPSAPAHYRAMPPKEAFVVLEYKEAGADDGSEDLSARSRLLAIDVGRDFALLREKYPDTKHFLIVPGMVRLLYQTKRDPGARDSAPGAYLRGAIVEMLVQEIFVPPDQRRVLESLSQTTDYLQTPESRTRGPRYSVVLNYGRNHEPWIGSCRLIATAQR